MPAPVITATHTVFRFGSGALPQFSAVATGPINWSAPHGTFAPATTASGALTTYTPENKSEGGELNGPPVTITAIDSADDAVSTTVIEIQATFPYQPNWNNAGRGLSDSTNVSLAEDLSPSFLEKSDIQRVYRYGFDRRRHIEWEEGDKFWQWHRRSRWFWLSDVPRNLLPATPLLFKVRFDSEFSDDPGGLNLISYSFVAKEAIDA